MKIFAKHLSFPINRKIQVQIKKSITNDFILFCQLFDAHLHQPPNHPLAILLSTVTA